MCAFEEGEQVKMMVVVVVFVGDLGLRSWKWMVGGVGLWLRGWEEVGEGFWRRCGERGGSRVEGLDGMFSGGWWVLVLVCGKRVLR